MRFAGDSNCPKCYYAGTSLIGTVNNQYAPGANCSFYFKMKLGVRPGFHGSSVWYAANYHLKDSEGNTVLQGVWNINVAAHGMNIVESSDSLLRSVNNYMDVAGTPTMTEWTLDISVSCGHETQCTFADKWPVLLNYWSGANARPITFDVAETEITGGETASFTFTYTPVQWQSSARFELLATGLPASETTTLNQAGPYVYNTENGVRSCSWSMGQQRTDDENGEPDTESYDLSLTGKLSDDYGSSSDEDEQGLMLNPEEEEEE